MVHLAALATFADTYCALRLQTLNRQPLRSDQKWHVGVFLVTMSTPTRLRYRLYMSLQLFCQNFVIRHAVSSLAVVQCRALRNLVLWTGSG